MNLYLNTAVILGNHSLYISFDTLENLTLMQGTERSDFDTLVRGTVIINIISQNCCGKIQINIY